jgi:hypothetical protein
LRRKRKKVFVRKNGKVIGDWRKFLIEGFHDLYTSPDFVQEIKSTGMRWAMHEGRMGRKRDL